MYYYLGTNEQVTAQSAVAY